MGPPCCCYQSSPVLCPHSTLVWAVSLALSSIVCPSEVKGRQAHLARNQPDTLGQQDTGRKWDLKASGSERCCLGWQLAFLQPFSTYVATMAPGKIPATALFLLRSRDTGTVSPTGQVSCHSHVELYSPADQGSSLLDSSHSARCSELAPCRKVCFWNTPLSWGSRPRPSAHPPRPGPHSAFSAAAGILKLSSDEGSVV